MNEIDFNDIESLKHNGFEGFKTIQELIQPDNAFVPKDKGVYLVINPSGCKPKFLKESSGGYFKGKIQKLIYVNSKKIGFVIQKFCMLARREMSVINQLSKVE